MKNAPGNPGLCIYWYVFVSSNSSYRSSHDPSFSSEGPRIVCSSGSARGSEGSLCLHHATATIAWKPSNRRRKLKQLEGTRPTSFPFWGEKCFTSAVVYQNNNNHHFVTMLFLHPKWASFAERVLLLLFSELFCYCCNESAYSSSLKNKDLISSLFSLFE